MGNTHSVGPHRTRKNVHWRAAEAPHPPGKPSATCGEGPDGREGRLRWLPPRHDGGSTLQGYIVECNRVGSPLWVRTNPPLVLGPELILAGLEPGFQYRFRVCAQNAAGVSNPSEVSDALHVSSERGGMGPPKFQMGLEDVESMENEKTEFRVYFDGNPVPTVSWFKDGFEIFSSRRTAILNEDHCSTLIFHQTSLNDEGEIKCAITNRVGHAVSRARLRLQAAPRVRLPRRYEDGLIFDAGETLVLKVAVAGKPNPEIQWRHDGQNVEENDRIQVSNGDKFSSLRIINASREDRGEYQVNAKNTVGEDLASILVTITSRPDPPKEVRAIKEGDRSAIISWEPPTDDGGCQIGNYIVEYYRTGWNVWLKATTERKLTAILSNLIEGSEYRFRVKAESPYGVSDPSVETESVFIPGKSSSTNFLSALEEEMTNNVIESPEIPSVMPRRKRQSSPKVDEDGRFNVELNESVPMRKHRNIDPKSNESGNLDVSNSNNNNDKMRYGSSEFMLILYPEGDKTDADKRKSFQLDLEDAMSPPVISLSAPQLGANMCLIQPMRNSVSSTELLHEHAMNRVYQVMALKEAEKAKAKKDFITNDANSYSDMRENSPYKENAIVESPIAVDVNVVDEEEEQEEEIQEDSLIEKDEYRINTKSDESLNMDKSEENSLFEDDYTTSTVSSGDSDYTDSDSLEDGRIRNAFDEDKTYHPREMVPKGIPKEQIQAPKTIPKPVPLPDPNFIPKPILKKREPTPVKPQIKEEKPPKTTLLNKVPLLQKITKSPLEKYIKVGKKALDKKKEVVNNKQQSNLNSNKDSLKPADNEKMKDKSPDILDGGHLVAERYGNMIKEFSSTKKQQPILYDNTEDLKKAAAQQQLADKSKNLKNNGENKNAVTKVAVKKTAQQKKLAKPPTPTKQNKEIKSVPKAVESSNAKKKVSANSTPSIQTVSLPKNFSELNAEAESNVRNAFSYIINIFMVLVAFWLYLFKSEFLAIPFIALAIYREMHEAFKNKMPSWLTNRISPK